MSDSTMELQASECMFSPELPTNKVAHLVTDRLYLRQWRDADREPLFAMNSDPRVMECFPTRLNRQESDAMAQRFAALISRRGWGFWAVESRSDSRFLGFVGLNVPAMELPFAPCVEIGWRLAADDWGKGYATEAGRAALHLAFSMMDLDEVVSFTAMHNERSRAVMERLGMERSGAFEHPAVPVGNPLREHVLYRLSCERWRALSDVYEAPSVVMR